MAGRASKGKIRGMLSDKVRVWWPPTKDKNKTEFSGMYWPAKVVRHAGDKYEVQYDNGDQEIVLDENVTPFNPPFAFGEETHPLQVGEFCEVFNESKTDPAAWVAKVEKVSKKLVRVSFPFHDAEDDWVKVSSPVELEQCDEDTLATLLSTDAKALTGRQVANRGPSEALRAEAAGSSKKEPAESVAPKQDTRRRFRYPTSSEQESEDSHRSPKRTKKLHRQSSVAGADTAAGGAPPFQGFVSHHVQGVGSVLIPLSSLVTSGSTALAPGVEAALKTWAAGQHQPRTTPDVAPAPGAAVAAAAATAPAAASLATLVPHLPQVLPAVASKTAHRLALLEAQRVAPNSPDVSLAASVTRAWTGEIRAGAGAAPSSPDQGLQQRPLQATSLLVDPVRQATSLAGLGNSLQEPAGRVAEASKSSSIQTWCKKDPNAPRQPLTAYLAFLDKYRGETARANPDASRKEQLRLLTAKWRARTVGEQEACQAAAHLDCQRHALEKEKYDAEHKQDALSCPPPSGSDHGLMPAAGNEQKRNGPSTLKKPRTAYNFFSTNFRKTLAPSVKASEGTKLAAEAWRSASEQAKAPNVAAANLEKQQYDKALDEYKITLQKAYQEAETAVEAAAVASHDAAVQPALYQEAQSQVWGPSNATGQIPPAELNPLDAWGGVQDTAYGVPEGLDLAKTKACLARAGFQQAVYYMLVDVWRAGSGKLPDAVRSYKAHVARKGKPDWKGFVIGIFGLDVITPLMNQRPAAHSITESTAPVLADTVSN